MKYLILIIFLLFCSCKNKNSFIDPRDGQEYRTVKMKDGKVWMAENLNFEINGSWNYNFDQANADKYGKLYTWDAAKKACPSGWHLPNDTEWWRMIKHYGTALNGMDINPTQPSAAEKSELAYNALIKGGDSGFSALLGGYQFNEGRFLGKGDYPAFKSLNKYGGYWTSTELNSIYAWYYAFSIAAFLIVYYFLFLYLGQNKSI